jgi:hypothetical protein
MMIAPMLSVLKIIDTLTERSADSPGGSKQQT